MGTDKKKILSIYILCAINAPFLFLIFLPDKPNEKWQTDLLRFIHEELYFTLGANGPIPLFTVLVSIYTMIVVGFWFVYILFKLYKEIGIGREFQKKIFEYIDLNIFNSKHTIWLKDHLILRKLCIYFMHASVLAFSVWHFTDENISFHHGRRGGIIGLAYQHRLGVIVMEYFFQFLILGNVYLLMIYTLYTFNIIRGYGWGNEVQYHVKKVIPIVKNKKTKKRKNGKKR